MFNVVRGNVLYDIPIAIERRLECGRGDLVFDPSCAHAKKTVQKQ